MKILHITYVDSLGAGLCCLRIHQSLLNQGVESRVLVFKKTTTAREVYGYGISFKFLIYRALNKIVELFGIRLTALSKVKHLRTQRNACYTSINSCVDLRDNNLVKWADIIHLHWVNWFVDYESFFPSIKKPIVWTLHDENLFCGAAHFTRDILDENIEMELCRKKQAIIGPLANLNLVFLSKFMYEKFSNHPIVLGKRKVVINNPVDTNVFVIYEQKKLRKNYGIPEGKIVFAFSALNINEERKGLKVLIDVLLNHPKAENMMILAIGGFDENVEMPDIVRKVGLISNSFELCRLMCCCNYYAMPSYQEAFSQSPIEAMSCGLPVVAFPCSGTQELIRDYNGVICKDFTTCAFAEGINTILNKTYNPLMIRKDIINRFSQETIAKKYIGLYKDIMSSGEI